MATGGVGEAGDQKLSNLECSICMEKYESARESHKIPKVINCGHTYCDGCVNSMIKNNRLDCPTCHKVSSVPQDGFSTNYDLLSLVDAEETRAKSFKYNCSDCSIGLTLDTAFKCKGNHDGVICIACYSEHSNHGGIEPLKFLLNKNRPTFDQGLKRLIENRERYKALAADIQHSCRTSLESWIQRLLSTNEYGTHVVDELRTEIDEINRVCDEGDSRLLEGLTISRRVQSFTVDCNFGNEWLDWNLELLRRKFNTLEAALSEMMKTEDDAGNCPARQNAHRFRPYLELLESRTVSDRSGYQTQGTQSADNNTASSSRPIRAPFNVVEFLPEPGGDGEASTSGLGMSGGGFLDHSWRTRARTLFSGLKSNNRR